MFGIWSNNNLEDTGSHVQPSGATTLSHNFLLGQGMNPRKKRRTLPNIFSKTRSVEGVAKFLKRFIPSGAPDSDARPPSSLVDCVMDTSMPDEVEEPSSLNTSPMEEPTETVEFCSVDPEEIGNVKNIPKKVYYDSVKKWPHVEISLSPKKSGVPSPNHRNEATVSRQYNKPLLWDATEESTAKGFYTQRECVNGKIFINSASVQIQPELLLELKEVVQIELGNGMSFTIKSHDKPNVPFKITMAHAKDSVIVTEISTDAIVFEASPVNFPSESDVIQSIIVNVASSDPTAKIKEIQLILELALDMSEDPTADGKLKLAMTGVGPQQYQMQRRASGENMGRARCSPIQVNQLSLKTKWKKSLIYRPFPNLSFKVKVLEPEGAQFKITYSNSMIPIVTTLGYVFEAVLQRFVMLRSKRTGLIISSELASTITVQTTHPLEKFEEIKAFLRHVCDVFFLSVPVNERESPETSNYNPSILEHGMEFVYRSPSLCARLVNRLAPGTSPDLLNVTEPRVAECSQTISSSQTSDVTGTSRRMSLRKNKYVGCCNEQSTPKLLYRPSGPEDRKYLYKKLNVKHFINDISGVPVVVLERLSADTIQQYSSS